MSEASEALAGVLWRLRAVHQEAERLEVERARLERVVMDEHEQRERDRAQAAIWQMRDGAQPATHMFVPHGPDLPDVCGDQPTGETVCLKKRWDPIHG